MMNKEIVISLIINQQQTYQLTLTPHHYQQQFRQFITQHQIHPEDAYYIKNIVQAKLMAIAKYKHTHQHIDHYNQQPKPSFNHIDSKQYIQSPRFKAQGINGQDNQINELETIDRQLIDSRQYKIKMVDIHANVNKQLFAQNQHNNNNGQSDKYSEVSLVNIKMNNKLEQDQCFQINFKSLVQNKEPAHQYQLQQQQNIQEMQFLPPKSQKTSTNSNHQPTTPKTHIQQSHNKPSKKQVKKQPNIQANKPSKQQKKKHVQPKPIKYNFIQTNSNFFSQQHQHIQPSNNHHLFSPTTKSKSPSSPSLQIFHKLHKSPTESFASKKNDQINPRQYEQYLQVQKYLMNTSLRRVSPHLFSHLHNSHTHSSKHKIKSEREKAVQMKQEISPSVSIEKRSIDKCFKGSVWQSGSRCEMKEYLKALQKQQQLKRQRQQQIKSRMLQKKSLQKESNKEQHKSRSCQKCSPKPQKKGVVTQKKRKVIKNKDSCESARPFINNLLKQCYQQFLSQ